MTKKVINPANYLDFINIFLKKLAVKLSKLSLIKKHLINLELDKQLSYNLIYNLRLVKFKILKIYIEINLVNGFIYFFKILVGAFILFV